MAGITTGALSATDSDDDYYVSYIVTMVDVRSCTRPPRIMDSTKYPGMCLVLSREIDPYFPINTLLDVYIYLILTSTGFTELQSHYSVLVRSMPDDYMNTVSQLERHLTGDHIGSILECRDVFAANQRILDCLIEQLGGERDAFDLCDWLSAITNAPSLTTAIEDFKKGTEC